MYDAGYDIVDHLDDVLEGFDRVVGLSKLKAVHLNDSKNPFESHKDRHEKIGEGSLGLAAFERIVTHPALEALAVLSGNAERAGWICKRDRAAARVCEIEEEGKRKWKTRERRIKELTEEKRRISTGKIKRKPLVPRKQRAWHRKKESRKRVHHRRNVLIRKNAADAHI